MVVGSSPTVGVAAEPTQSLSSVNLQTMHPVKNAGTADWSCLGGFSDPHQTRANIWKRLLKIFSESGVAQGLACWAHNPKVPGSKPGSAMHALIQDWPVPCATQPIPHSPAILCSNLPYLQLFQEEKSPNNKGGRSRARERRKKEGQRRKRNQRSEKKQTEGKRNARTKAEKSNKTKEKKQKRAKGNKTRIDKETSNKTKEKETKNDKKQGKKVKTKEKEANEMKAEQKARKQEQKGTRRQRRHGAHRKRKQFVEAWKTTLIECKVLKFSSFGRSPPSSVGRAQGP